MTGEARRAGVHGFRAAVTLSLAGLLAAFLVVGACSALRPAETASPPLILVGLDAFRWDFMGRARTPTLDRIAAEGVRAERLIPSFPTKTFPNHYTLVTGLYPDHHGIVANNIYDPEHDERFSLDDRAAVEDPRWWHGEPLWVTARLQGKVAASMFWPGSEAPIKGLHPNHWRNYEGSISHEERVDEVLGWLDLPAAERPSFITLYFSDVDDIAHHYDPDTAPQIGAAVAKVDAALGRLVAGLEARGLWGRAHLVVVSDHGMTSTPPGQVIVLDDYVDLEMANVIDWTPVLAVWPRVEDVDEVYGRLAGAHPHLSVYRKEEIPERLHYRDSPRVAPIIALADEGWRVTSRAYLELKGGRLAAGDHGYDHELEDMGALFLAAGPGLRQGQVVPPLSNIHIYELMCHLLDLDPAPNDGSLAAVRHLLREAGSQPDSR
jgi:predicted AlkP superfamily pyrophosphatase or phosphodiesterase